MRFFRGRRASLGARGERAAARFLKRRGYRMLYRNYRDGYDEADLIALDPGGTVVIVEVKTRSSDVPPPELGFNGGKLYRQERVARGLRRQRRFRDVPIRLDGIAIVWPPGERPDIRHYVNIWS